MIIYLAGVPGGGSPGYCRREKELNPMWYYRLWTYYYLKLNKGIMKKPKHINLFLDSGAFSAFTKNGIVDIQEYIAFIKKHQKYIDVYANLDVIGEDGKNPNRVTAQKTLENQQIMEEAGLSPLPVYHFGEPTEYLDFYIENYGYLALGGLVGSTNEQLVKWLDSCFSYHICRPDGLPKVKVHAFGVTSLAIMLRYPWYSIDSTTWVVMGRNGKILVPRYKKGKWIYDKNSWKISVSARSPDIKKDNAHYLNKPPEVQKLILDYIHSKGYVMGVSSFKKVDKTYKPQEEERWAEKKEEVRGKKRLLEIIEEPGVCNKYQLRDELNIIYFNDLEKFCPSWPWPFKIQKLNQFNYEV